MADVLASNPLTAKPTDALVPEAKGFDPAQQAVLKAEQEQERFKTFQDLTKSEQQKMLTEGNVKAAETYAKEAQPKELTDELKKKVEETATPFIPNQQTAGDLGTIFAVTNILGFAIGRGAKGSAQAALSAQNGMLEGYQKGNMDVYKKQKDIFDENQKSLSKAIEGLKYELTQAEKTASVNKELAMAQVQQAVSKYGADTLGKYIDQFGLPKGVEYVKSLERMDKENQDRILKQKKEAFDMAMQTANLALNKERVALQKEKLSTKGSSALVAGRAENIREAFVQAAKDVENISKFPKGTVLSTFSGMSGQDGATLTQSLANTFARNVTPDDSRFLQQLTSGLEINMANALGGGYASSAAKSRIDTYKSQIPKEGDSAEAAAMFLARIKQEMNILAENFPSKPGASEQMNNAVQAANDRINQSIPFDVNDVLDAHYKQANPQAEHPQDIQDLLKKYSTGD